MRTYIRKAIILILLALLHKAGWAQLPPGNKPAPSLVEAPAGSASPASLPAAYTAGFGVNFVRTREAVAPIKNEAAFDTASYLKVKQRTDYLDGLGRLLQTVSKQATPGSDPKDAVTPVVYDQYGGETYRYLPYIPQDSVNMDGSFKMKPFSGQQSFFTTTYRDGNGGLMYAGEQFFYSKSETELSPLNRVSKAMAPGNSWVGSGRGTSYQYLTNLAVDQVVRWKIACNPLQQSNEAQVNIPVMDADNPFFQEGELYKNVSRDEQGHVVVEYKNRQGQTLLKKVQAAEVPDDHSGYKGWLSTCYVYDDFDQIRFVMPPKAVEWLLGHDWNLNSDEGRNVVAELCFRYEYNDRHLLAAKKVPGAGWVYMVYDARNRLVLSQDANQRERKQWMDFIYDSYNRLVTTGIYDCDLGYQQLQEIMKKYVEDITLAPELQAYEQISLIVTHFDNYKWINVSYNDKFNQQLEGLALHADALPSTAEQKKISVKGLVTGTDVVGIGNAEELITGQWIGTYLLYDSKGRLIQTQRNNYNTMKDITTNRYDFSGNVVGSYLVHEYPQASATSIRVKSDFEYDHTGKMLTVWKTVNDRAETRTQVIHNDYDELGMLKSKELGRKRLDGGSYSASMPVEKLDYTYNIRGWLKGINASYSHPGLGARGTTDRWFGMELSYDWGSMQKENNQYTGNISLQTWRSKGDGIQRSYGYSYDAVSRLTGADFSELTGAAYADNPAVMFDVMMGDSANLSGAYDAGGNILGMTQWGMKPGGSSLIDKLTYKYFDNSNKLRSVTEDPATSSANGLGDFTDFRGDVDYGYDRNGNLISDLNKQLKAATGINLNSGGAILYNNLNLPWKITVSRPDGAPGEKGTITNIYDAQGNKIEKKVVENPCEANRFQQRVTTTTYVGPFVYQQVNSDTPRLQFISQEEGRIRLNGTGDQVEASYDYFIRDHLGNVRMVLTDELAVDPYPVLSFDGGENDLGIQQHTWDDGNSQPLQVSSVRVARPGNFGDSNTNGHFAMLVQKKSGAIGAAKLLKVMSGDRIHTSVEYYYTASNADNGKADAVSSLLTNLMGLLPFNRQVAGSIKGQTGSIADALSVTSGLGTLLNDPVHQAEGHEAPKAYLNILLFDEQFRIDKEHSRVIPVAYQPGQKGLLDQRLANAVEVKKNGYVYVYFSNESNEMVYFDNFMLSHERGSLLEETHYYPFGLTMTGISSKALKDGVKNQRKFNGANELQNEEFSDGTGLEMYDAVHRMYDPQIGRFGQIDEFGETSESSSPYVFASNDPISRNDPFGLADTVVNGEHASSVLMLQAVSVIGHHSERVLQNTYWNLKHTGVSFETIKDPKLRNWLYRNDRLQNYLARVHEDIRDQGILATEIAVTFVPIGDLVSFGKVGAAMFRMFRLRRAFSFGSLLFKDGVEAEMQLVSHEVLPSLSKMTPDQVALKDLVKEITFGARKPLSASDTKIVRELAEEVQYPGFRATAEDMAPINNHWQGGPHIHLPGVANHIPIIN